MITALLIANRGEIACRIIRTCRRLGIRAVAVFSDADAGALHVRMADEAVHIGPAPAHESYLNADALLAAARRAQADAVRPELGSPAAIGMKEIPDGCTRFSRTAAINSGSAKAT